MNNANITDW